MPTPPLDRLRRSIELIERIQLPTGPAVNCPDRESVCSGCEPRQRSCADFAAELDECAEVLPMLAEELRAAVDRGDNAALAEYGAELVIARARIRQAVHHLLTSPGRHPDRQVGWKVETVYDLLIRDLAEVVDADRVQHHVA